MKLKISRSVTINTGNYTSIKPSVELEIDVKAELAKEAYKHLSRIGDCLMAYETVELADVMQAINDVGWGRYLELLKNSKDKINSELKANMDELIKYEQ